MEGWKYRKSPTSLPNSKRGWRRSLRWKNSTKSSSKQYRHSVWRKESKDGIPLQVIIGDKDIPSDEKVGNAWVPLQIDPSDETISSDEQEGNGRIPPLYQDSYTQICLFEETEDILLFKKRSCEVSISVNPITNKMHHLEIVFGTGAGPTLIWKNFPEADWLKSVQVNNQPSLKNATNQKVSIIGAIKLHVRIRVSTVMVVFGVVPDVAVLVSQGPRSSTGSWRAASLPERKIVPYNSKQVPIININDLPKEHKGKDDKVQKRITTKGAQAPLLVYVAENKHTTKTSRDYISSDRCENASADKTTTRLGQYLGIDEMYGNYRYVPEPAIWCNRR